MNRAVAITICLLMSVPAIAQDARGLQVVSREPLDLAFRRLRAANQYPVVVETVVPGIYRVGEKARVEWWAVSPVGEPGSFSLTLQPEESIDLRDTSFSQVVTSYASKQDFRDGIAVRMQRIGELDFVPERTGTFSIPSVTFRGEFRPADPTAGQLPHFRTSDPAYVAILARPDGIGADVPIGRFTMRCDPNTYEAWPALIVTAEGTGSLGSARLRIANRTDYPVVMRAREQSLEETNHNLRRVWTLHAHTGATDDRIEVVLDAWNPESGETEALRCSQKLGWGGHEWLSQETEVSSDGTPADEVPLGLEVLATLISFGLVGTILKTYL